MYKKARAAAVAAAAATLDDGSESTIPRAYKQRAYKFQRVHNRKEQSEREIQREREREIQRERERELSYQCRHEVAPLDAQHNDGFEPAITAAAAAVAEGVDATGTQLSAAAAGVALEGDGAGAANTRHEFKGTGSLKSTRTNGTPRPRIAPLLPPLPAAPKAAC